MLTRAEQCPGLALGPEGACGLLQASAKPGCALTALDLSGTEIYYLDDLVDQTDVVCRLTYLDLSGNALGGFDDDCEDDELSVGTCNTMAALEALLTQYTSLRSLDLSCNAMTDHEARLFSSKMC
ncbi:MAG: hypothetical protein WCP53_00315 [Verrucomicrobiota bacterium]